MRLKLAYRRTNGEATDIVITTDASATAADIARELLEADPLRPEVPASTLTLSVAPPGGAGVVLPPERALGEAPIASGYEVRVVPAVAEASRGGVEAAVLRIVAGPGAGRQFSLPAGATIIGRDEEADLVLEDPYVSKKHARIEVSGVIELVDLNSANGILVDGETVTRVTLVSGQEVQLGDTRIQIALTAPSTTPVGQQAFGGAIPFDRSPRVEPRYPEHQHPRPAVPAEPDPPVFSPIMLIGPIIMGLAMYTMTQRPMSLLMVTMAPMMAGANFFNKKMSGKKKMETETGKFLAQMELLEQQLTQEQAHEAVVRRAEVPSVAEVYQAGHDRSALLWTRRPEHWSFLTVRFGTAALLSRNTIAQKSETDNGLPRFTRQLRELEERHQVVPDVPVLESGLNSGAFGVVGTTYAADALRGLLVQLAGLHSPSELVIAALASPDEISDLNWLRWLPHTASPQSPISGIHLAETQTSVAQVISELENLVAQRLGSREDDMAEPMGPMVDKLVATATGGELGELTSIEPPPVPVVVLVVTEHAPIDRSRLVQLAERGKEVGILPVCIASRSEALLPSCRSFVDVSAGLDAGAAHFVRHGAVVQPVKVEGVSAEHAERFAVALAPLYDSGALVEDSSDLPRHVSMVTLLGPDLAESSDAVVERWRQNLSVHDRVNPPKARARAGSLRALVGQAGVDAMHLDLRTQGPHALVGGTTGAGKSEFLQAWVLGMAAEYSPDRVTFLFVDYKGGAAFAECTRLPHCVGLVTDLSPHLVRRALTSLRAELHHREHLLNRKKAKDLLELEKRGDPEAPPALVLVIDEFAALSKEVPEFVDGVVDIAQRGRSLGIHLIMATQRPAGVIKDNLRANTNLRIALRMADESDSNDVIGSNAAAHFDPSLPGRGVAKSGPGRLTPFQSGYAGGHTTADVNETVSVVVNPLKFGALERWQKPQPDVEPEVEDLGPTDQVRLVESIIGAQRVAEIPSPRKPWLEELSTAYDLALLGPRTDTQLLLGVADLPEKQAQEVLSFKPDIDGNLAVYGTGGSGKTVVLRTLGIGAGVTPRGGPVHVYGLDFAAGGLRILEPLPHVGAIVSGDDQERVVRLLRELRDIVEDRARRYPEVSAGSISEYRALANKPDEPRILLLLDNFPGFREIYEYAFAQGEWYGVLQQLMSEGRALGIHVVFTVDRPGAVPGSVASSVPRRVVLKLADKATYGAIGAPSDVLDSDSPPGRAIIDGMETQIAILGGSGNVSDQSQAIARLARSIERQGRPPAPDIRTLPIELELAELPPEVDGMPVLGLGDLTLEPFGFEPAGTFMIGGPPGSGKTNTILAMAKSLRRWKKDVALVYLGARRSLLPTQLDWDLSATSLDEVGTLAKQLAERIKSREPMRHTAVFIEGVADFSQTPAESAVVELVKAIRNSEHLVVGEAETANWGSIFPIFSNLRSSRRGILLQPDWQEGDAIMKTPFPRAKRAEFPVGRGMFAARGKSMKVQVPLAEGGEVPIEVP